MILNYENLRADLHIGWFAIVIHLLILLFLIVFNKFK